MRVDEGTVTIHGADAVTITVGGQARIIFSPDNGFLQRADVRFDRFWVNTAKARITSAANFVAMDAVTAKKLGKQACRGPVHSIEDKTEIGFANAIPVDELFERVEIGSAGLERQN